MRHPIDQVTLDFVEEERQEAYAFDPCAEGHNWYVRARDVGERGEHPVPYGTITCERCGRREEAWVPNGTTPVVERHPKHIEEMLNGNEAKGA